MLKSLKVTQLRRRRSVIQHGSFWWTKLIPSRIFYRLRPEHFRSCVNKMRLVPTVAYFSPNYISLRASLISSIIKHQSQRRFEQTRPSASSPRSLRPIIMIIVVVGAIFGNRTGRAPMSAPSSLILPRPSEPSGANDYAYLPPYRRLTGENRHDHRTDQRGDPENEQERENRNLRMA